MKRRYRISADDGKGKPGSPLGYAEKELKVADELTIYRDEQRTEKLVTVWESTEGRAPQPVGTTTSRPSERWW